MVTFSNYVSNHDVFYSTALTRYIGSNESRMNVLVISTYCDTAGWVPFIFRFEAVIEYYIVINGSNGG